MLLGLLPAWAWCVSTRGEKVFSLEQIKTKWPFDEWPFYCTRDVVQPFTAPARIADAFWRKLHGDRARRCR